MDRKHTGNEEEYFSITKFSEISGTSRQSLIYYDKIGLFKPARRERNGYRWYRHNQIEEIFLIQTLAAAGLSLKEIEEYMESFDPDRAKSIFNKRKAAIQQEIKLLQSKIDMIDKRLEDIETAENLTDSISVSLLKSRQMYLSHPFRFPALEIPASVWVDFYNSFPEHNLSFGYPICYLVSEEDIKEGKWNMVSRIGVFLRSDDGANYETGSGDYASACGVGHYGNTEAIYRKLIDYLKQNGYEIDGPAYEEYILDEVLRQDQDQFLIVITVPVRKKCS